MSEGFFDRVWLERKGPASPKRAPLLLRLSGAVAANLLAILLAYLLGGDQQGFQVVGFMVAVMLSSWLGGRLVGLAAVAFCTWSANSLVFTPNAPAVTFSEAFLRLCAFSAAGLLVSSVNSGRSALERSERLRLRSERSRRWAEAVLEQTIAPLLLLRLGTREIVFANGAARSLAEGRYPVMQAGQKGPSTAFFTSAGKDLALEDMPISRAARGEHVLPMRMECKIN
jgi:hypothetical protein